LQKHARRLFQAAALVAVGLGTSGCAVPLIATVASQAVSEVVTAAQYATDDSIPSSDPRIVQAVELAAKQQTELKPYESFEWSLPQSNITGEAFPVASGDPEESKEICGEAPSIEVLISQKSEAPSFLSNYFTSRSLLSLALEKPGGKMHMARFCGLSLAPETENNVAAEAAERPPTPSPSRPTVATPRAAAGTKARL
jgi:hypothetical protein